MAGYSSRQTTFTTGDTITAAHSNNEFNAVLAAFHVTTGHKHDGSTAGEGGPISTLFSNAISMGTGADTDVALTFNANTNDGVLTWMEDQDYFQFSDDILISTTEKILFRDTALYINSSTDGQLDLVADTKIQLTATTIGLSGAVSGTAVLDEDNLASNSATQLATQQSIKAYVDATVTAEDLDVTSDSGTIAIDLDSETLTIAGGTGLSSSATSNTVTVAVDAAQTGITSLLAADIKIGEDNETKIDFEDANEIHFYAANAEQVYVADGIFGPQTDSDVDLGSTGVRWKDAFIDTVTTTGNVTVGGDLTISGDDLTMNTNTVGNLLIADGTNYNPTAVTDLGEISSVASGDVLLAVDASGGGLKKITRSTLVAGLATSSGIANVAEDTTPQLGGNLDAQGKSVTDVGILGYSYGASGSPTVVAVTVASKTSGHPYNGDGSSSAYFLDGAEAPAINLNGVDSVTSSSGYYYKFDQAHSSNSGHPLRFYLDAAKSLAYTTGVTTSGTPGTAGAHTTIAVTDQTPSTLYYQCSSHAYMGNYASVDSAYIASSGAVTIDAVGDVTLDADGGDIFFKDGGTTFGSATNVSGNLILKSGTTTALTFAGANSTIAGNLIVTGNHTVNGTTTTVNSATVTIDDPIFTLGGDSAPSSDDNKDRGIEFRYHTGSAAKVGFFGWDDNEGAFTFVPDATNSSEVFSGTVGNVIFGNITGTLTTAAQGNVTSLGTLSTLTVDNVIINGATIGHTSDTDLMTLASGGLTVAGTIEATGTITGTLATAAQTSITSTGDLGGGSIAAGFGAIDNGTSGIRTNTFTAETSVVPAASGGADLGSTALEWGDLYIADDKKIYLGSDQNISIEYDEDGNDTTAVVAAGGVSLAPHGTGTGNGTELRFQELAANGANYVGFKAPDAVAANKVFILPNADGSADQVLKTNGSLALDWTDQASGGVINRVADGAIAIRKPVVLTSAGKAKQVAQTTTTTVASTATVKQITDMDGSDTATDVVATTYEASSERFVMFYRDTSNSNYPTIVAGAWSSGTVTWGTPLAIESTALAQEPSIDSGDGYVFTHYDIGTGKMKVFSISGTTFTLTATETISSTNPAGTKIAYVPSSAFSSSPYNPVSGMACCIYSHSGTGSEVTYVRSYCIRASNGTNNGQTTEEAIISTNAHMNRASMVADPDNGKAIYATFDGSDGDVGKAVVIGFGGTASSPTDTVGTFVDYSGSDDGDYASICYDTQNNKVFVAWKNDDGSSDVQVKGAIGTVTAGTNAISFAGTATIWDGTDTNQGQFDVAFDTVANKIGFFYRDDDNSDKLTHKIITPGASSFSVANGATMSNGDAFLQSNSATYGTGKGFLVGLNDRTDSNKVAYATAFLATSTSTTTTLDNANYLGVSAAAISDGATGKINIPGGLSEGHSSLTIEDHYYTNGAGTVGKIGNATGEHYLGKAISATEILLTKEQDNYIHATAEGAITVGKGVVINSSGDAEQVSASGKSEWVVGTKTDLNHNGMSSQSNIIYDTVSDKYFMSIRGAGTVNNGLDSPKVSGYVFSQASDGALSITNPVEVAANADGVATAYDASTGMIATAYRDKANSYYGTMVIGAISGTTYSKGTAVVYESANPTDEVAIAAGNGRAVVVFKDASDNKAKSRLGVITAGTKAVAFESEVDVDDTAGVSTISVSFDATQNKFLVAWHRSSNASGAGVWMAAGSLSGNTISYGTKYNFPGNVANNDTFAAPVVGFDPGSGKHLIIYSEPQGTGFDYSLRANVVTISGSNVSIGSVLDMGGITNSAKIAPIVSEGSNVMSIIYNDTNQSGVAVLRRGTISGTDITFAAEKILEAGRPTNSRTSLAYNPDLNRYMAQVYGTDDGDNDIYPLTATSPNSADFVGIATKTVADDEQAELVIMGGEQSGYAGLTPGSDVYVGTDGTISSTAASPSVVAGKALTANKILIKA